MDRNRLGVGIVFSGLDRGLSKSADEVARSMTRAADAMRTAEKASMGNGAGLLAEIGRGMQDVATQGKDAFTGFDAGAKMTGQDVGGLTQAIQLLQTEVHGLGKALNGAQGELDQTTKAVQDVKRAASGKGFFSDIQRGMSMLSLGRIGSLLNDVKDGMGGAGKGVSEMAKSIDELGAKMRASLDPKTASRFSSSLTGLLGVGVTAEQATTIGKSLTNAGAPLEDMRQALPMIGELVGKMGMDAGKVADMFGNAVGNLGMAVSEVTDLTKGIVKLQREYQVTDMVEHLPEFIDNAYNNLIRFGKVNKKESMRAVGDLAKMAAGFQKVGFAQAQAAKMATGFASHMGDIRYEFDKMRAGLGGGEKMQEMMKAFGAGGLDASKLVTAIQNGTMSSDDALTEMRKMVSTVNDPELKRNMMVRLREAFGPEMAAIFDPLSADLDKVNAKAEEVGKGVTPEAAFNDLSKAMGGTLGFQEKMLETTKQLFEASKDFAARADLVKGMQAQIKAINEFQKKVGDTDSILGKVISKLHAWGVVGGSMFGEDAAKVQVFSELLTSLIFPLTSVLGLATLLLKPFKLLGQSFAFLGKKMGLVAVEGEAAVGLGARLRKAFKPLKSLLTAPFETMGMAAGKAGGAFEALGAVMKKYIIGPVKFIFEKLGGKFILKMLGKLLPAAVARFGGIAASWLGGPIVGGIVTVLGLLDLLADIWPWLTKQVRKFSPAVADVMDEIGAAVGAVWGDIKAAGAEVWKAVLEGWEEIKPDLLIGWKALQQGAKELWGGIKVFAVAAWAAIKEGWAAIAPKLIAGVKALWTVQKAIWKGIAIAAIIAWDLIKAGAQLLWPVLKAGVKLWWKINKAIWGAIGDVVTHVWGVMKAGWEVIGPYLIAGAKEWWKQSKFIWGAIADAVTWTWGVIEAGWTWIKPWLVKGLKLVAVVATVAFALIVESVKAMWEFYSWVFGKVTKTAKEAWAFVSEGADEAMKSIKAKLDTASKWWEETSKDISGRFSKAWEDIKEGVASAMKFLSEKMATVKTALADLNPFKGMFENKEVANGMSKMMDDNLLKPFMDIRNRMIALAKEAGEKIGEYIPDWVKDLMGGVAGFKDKVMARAAAAQKYVGGLNPFSGGATAQTEGAVSGAPAGATKGDEAGAQVIPMPPRGSTAERDMSADDDMPRAKPTKNQRGAVAAAREAGVDLNPSRRPAVGDKNFQAIVDAINDEREALAKLLAALLDKDTSVEIKGDMAKFMRAVGSRTSGDTARAGAGDAFGS